MSARVSGGPTMTGHVVRPSWWVILKTVLPLMMIWIADQVTHNKNS